MGRDTPPMSLCRAYCFQELAARRFFIRAKNNPSSHISIILMSSLSQQNAAKLQSDGATAHIQKSHSNTSALVRAVDRALGLSTPDQTLTAADGVFSNVFATYVGGRRGP
jgi:hypothetical protein